MNEPYNKKKFNHKYLFIAIHLSYKQVTLKHLWYKPFIHTLQHLNQFPKKRIKIISGSKLMEIIVYTDKDIYKDG
jgi:hypothetical protein